MVSSRLIRGLRKGISVAALVPQPGRGWQGQGASSERAKRTAADTVVNSDCNAGTGDPVPRENDARKPSARLDARSFGRDSPEGRAQAVPFGSGFGAHATAVAETCGGWRRLRAGPNIAG
ncbi:hypothetical protein HOE425_320239 [Hoeflea sp. EC-HK425]|nr:hypothetical protein HOE425_320239 [Hoeflea sp. EC-HK425]